MKILTLIMALSFCHFAQAQQQKDIQIVGAITSSLGHTIYIGEDEEAGIKTTHLSVSFENKICIKGLMKLQTANEKVKLNWVKGDLLRIKIPFFVERSTEIPLGFLECESQRVDINIEEYRYNEIPEDN